MDVRTEKNIKARQKLENVKTAMVKKKPVYYNNKPYQVQALRMYYSAAFGGVVYQAEIVDDTPLDWNKVIVVGLDMVKTESEPEAESGLDGKEDGKNGI